MKTKPLLIALTILLGSLTDECPAAPPSWETLTSGQDVQMQTEVPKEIRGKYALLQLAKNDSEWKDVSKHNIHFMTLDANSTTEQIRGAKRTVQKVATKRNDKGNLVVILLLSDNTTLVIDLWNPANNLALVIGDERDATGTLNTIKMRCSISKD